VKLWGPKMHLSLFSFELFVHARVTNFYFNVSKRFLILVCVFNFESNFINGKYYLVRKSLNNKEKNHM
jgi:hypothetical protein